MAVPVTTPLLAGSRVRASSHAGIEIVVPNPSGAQGFYIVHLAGLLSLCSPTVHDAVLLQQLSQVGPITPETVRQTAINVAMDGYAGHAAAVAAEQLLARDRARQVRTRFALMAALVEQLDPNAAALPRSPAAKQLELRAEAVLRRLSGAIGVPPSRLAEGVQALSEAYAPVGFPNDHAEARIPQVMDRLETTRIQIADWLQEDKANDVGGLGQAMADPLQLNCEIAASILHATRSRLANPRELLRHWIANPEEALAIAARPAWLLDGWDHFCLVWMSAETDLARRSTLLELPQYMPVLPREVADWTSMHVPAAATEQSCRVVSREDSWRTGGAAFALIERNEKLRAWSL